VFRHHITSVAAALAVVFAPQRASTQQPRIRTPKQVVATVAMVDSLPFPGVPFVVQRRPDRTPRDLILVRASATPNELSDAVWTLLNARRAGGDYPIAKAMVRMRPGQQSPKLRKQFPGTPGVLGRLHSAKPRAIEGIGTARAVAIWLPRQGHSSGSTGPKKP